MFKLTVVKGAAKGKEFAIKDLTIIGRLRTNAVPIDDSMSSREHSRITKEADGYYLEDLKSRNGTLLNGQKIEKNRLSPGDLITVGRTEFKFEEGAVSAPPENQPKEKPAAGSKPQVSSSASENNQPVPAKTANIFYYFIILMFFAILFWLSYSLGKLWIEKIMTKKQPPAETGPFQ